ncbi:DUF2199 domain-containing protein [Paenibacillus alginolyticus]|uniref:DUF2199 domain-containing protein n=1 Tax=Paenibacillus alginolyticus TaxID=59839 RepID=UPI0035E41CB2
MRFFKRKSNGYICSCCGKRHDELPMSYGSNAPYYWFQSKPEERDVRFDLNSDLCIMDDEHYFIRGNIEIPVFEEKQVFTWDVWVSLSKDNFNKAVSTWSKSGREKELEPMFGWLSTSIPCYSVETMNLKTMVNIRKVGIRPYIELEPNEHPLALEQRNGISIKRVQEIAEHLLHKNV